MPKPDPGGSPEAQQRQEESRRSLAGGGLPLHAVARLQEQARRQGTPGEIFTSDLSVNELGLSHAAGFRPLGQVMGSTVYQVGIDWRTANWRDSDRGKPFSYEMQMASTELQETMRLALDRMRQEAALLGASCVIGTQLTLKELSWAENVRAVLECVAIGTAVREVGAPPGGGAPAVLTTLSGQEFWALRQAGYRPVGLATGACVYYHIPSPASQKLLVSLPLGGALRNQELEDCTQAVYGARALAVGRMEDAARALDAAGVVDTRISARSHMETAPNAALPGLLTQFTAIGTAIAAAPSGVPVPTLSIMSLR